MHNIISVKMHIVMYNIYIRISNIKRTKNYNINVNIVSIYSLFNRDYIF